jgi:hypothetical protein
VAPVTTAFMPLNVQRAAIASTKQCRRALAWRTTQQGSQIGDPPTVKGHLHTIGAQETSSTARRTPLIYRMCIIGLRQTPHDTKTGNRTRQTKMPAATQAGPGRHVPRAVRGTKKEQPSRTLDKTREQAAENTDRHAELPGPGRNRKQRRPQEHQQCPRPTHQKNLRHTKRNHTKHQTINKQDGSTELSKHADARTRTQL